MTYDELIHCIHAVAESTGEDELYLFGSQSVLMHFPEQLPYDACESRESDIMTEHNSKSNADCINGLFNEYSDFHSLHDLVIDGVLEENLSLPVGWEQRVVTYIYNMSPIRTIHIYVPDVNDIATAKLSAHREKDRR